MTTVRPPSAVEILGLIVAAAAFTLAVKTDRTIDRMNPRVTESHKNIGSVTQQLGEIKNDVSDLGRVMLDARDGIRGLALTSERLTSRTELPESERGPDVDTQNNQVRGQ